MTYRQLDADGVVAYVQASGLFPAGAAVEAREIGNGNVNLVFQARSDGRALIVKQAVPYVRCVGPSWPLTLDRARIEADALEIQNRHASGLVPRLLHRDDDLALLVMEDLSHLDLMRSGMIQLRRYPRFADHISTFLADMAFYTSDFYLPPHDKKALVKRFINPAMCQLIEDLTFTDPYYDAPRNIVNPALRGYLEQTFWKKTALRLDASKMKYKFLTEAQSLLHDDLHTGSIFADEENTRVFDPEFAFVGPSAFDLGILVGNFIINYVSLDGTDCTDAQRRDYRRYLLASVEEIWDLFRRKFAERWARDATEIIARVPGFLGQYLDQLFIDTIGYAAIEMIRRTHGLAHNADVDRIEDLQRRRDVQVRILELAEPLLMGRTGFDNEIGGVTQRVKHQIG
jgi:5-methylthioribose kinase